MEMDGDAAMRTSLVGDGLDIMFWLKQQYPLPLTLNILDGTRMVPQRCASFRLLPTMYIIETGESYDETDTGVREISYGSNPPTEGLDQGTREVCLGKIRQL